MAMRFPHALRSRLRRFGRDEDGTLLAEAVIVLPLMLWAYMALFVYWDAYRAVNTVQKAAYTVSDMVSREMVTLNTAYVPGMRDLMRYLVDTDQTVKIRVSSVSWNEANDRFEVDWSRSPDNAMPQLTTASIQSLASSIPEMADGDRVMLVETEVSYKPAFNVGIDESTLKQFIVTRPRFVPKVCLQGVVCS
jgi:Flp pilus assembly protein TadG